MKKIQDSSPLPSEQDFNDWERHFLTMADNMAREAASPDLSMILQQQVHKLNIRNRIWATFAGIAAVICAAFLIHLNVGNGAAEAIPQSATTLQLADGALEDTDFTALLDSVELSWDNEAEQVAGLQPLVSSIQQEYSWNLPTFDPIQQEE